MPPSANIYDFQFFRDLSKRVRALARSGPEPTANQELLTEIQKELDGRSPADLWRAEMAANAEQIEHLLRQRAGLIARGEDLGQKPDRGLEKAMQRFLQFYEQRSPEQAPAEALAPPCAGTEPPEQPNERGLSR